MRNDIVELELLSQVDLEKPENALLYSLDFNQQKSLIKTFVKAATSIVQKHCE